MKMFDKKVSLGLIIASREFFNGTLADTSFRRHVLRTLPHHALHFTRLPSTSPANAAYSYARRLEAWRALTTSAPGG